MCDRIIIAFGEKKPRSSDFFIFRSGPRLPSELCFTTLHKYTARVHVYSIASDSFCYTFLFYRVQRKKIEKFFAPLCIWVPSLCICLGVRITSDGRKNVVATRAVAVAIDFYFFSIFTCIWTTVTYIILTDKTQLIMCDHYVTKFLQPTFHANRAQS